VTCGASSLIQVDIDAQKPFLLLALDDYFSDPSQDCLARLFDAVNSMDLSLVPWLTRHEKLVMRFSERKDIFAEKFPPIVPRDAQLCGTCGSSHGTTSTYDRLPNNSSGSISSFEDGFLVKNGEQVRSKGKKICKQDHELMDLVEHGYYQEQKSSSDSTFSLGESAVWIGDETELPLNKPEADQRKSVATNCTVVDSESRPKSQDASSASFHLYGKDTGQQVHATLPGHCDNHVQFRTAITKDTHFYHTIVAYRDHHLPIKLPLSTFPEEVGDVRLVPRLK
jgi:hypothetical protein